MTLRSTRVDLIAGPVAQEQRICPGSVIQDCLRELTVDAWGQISIF